MSQQEWPIFEVLAKRFEQACWCKRSLKTRRHNNTVFGLAVYQATATLQIHQVALITVMSLQRVRAKPTLIGRRFHATLDFELGRISEGAETFPGVKQVLLC